MESDHLVVVAKPLSPLTLATNFCSLGWFVKEKRREEEGKGILYNAMMRTSDKHPCTKDVCSSFQQCFAFIHETMACYAKEKEEAPGSPHTIPFACQ